MSMYSYQYSSKKYIVNFLIYHEKYGGIVYSVMHVSLPSTEIVNTTLVKTVKEGVSVIVLTTTMGFNTSICDMINILPLGHISNCV